ncbi:hypothetical protein AB1Y20_015714 [Prymnesium parvum]|uniref:Uncharacterized protein n=1 Tax=Prymnesium parvum TaxID=97485 RepID=A0AB34K1R2_PRYPA
MVAAVKARCAFPIESVFGPILGPVVLVLPAGPSRPEDIAHAAVSAHVRVLPIDLELGGLQHDLRRTVVQRAVIELCLMPGVVASVHIATDCRSFSPLNAHLRLRPPSDPDGRLCPSDFREYISQQNTMIELCATIATIMCTSGRGFTWENPPDLSDPSHLPCWAWPEMGEVVACLWQTSWLRALRASFDLVMLHSSMCMFGSEFRKYFSLLMPRHYHKAFVALDGRLCPRTGAHAQHVPACGLDADGLSRATLAGQYPWRLSVALLRGHARCAASACCPPQRVEMTVRTVGSSDSDGESGLPSEDGGDAPPPSVMAMSCRQLFGTVVRDAAAPPVGTR